MGFWVCHPYFEVSLWHLHLIPFFLHLLRTTCMRPLHVLCIKLPFLGQSLLSHKFFLYFIAKRIRAKLSLISASLFTETKWHGMSHTFKPSPITLELPSITPFNTYIISFFFPTSQRIKRESSNIANIQESCLCDWHLRVSKAFPCFLLFLSISPTTFIDSRSFPWDFPTSIAVQDKAESQQDPWPIGPCLQP